MGAEAPTEPAGETESFFPCLKKPQKRRKTVSAGRVYSVYFAISQVSALMIC